MTKPVDPDEREIAERLKLWRTKRLMSQAAFARALQIQPTTLWTYEAGRVPLKAAVALQAWRALNLNPRWLRRGEGPETLDFETFGASLARNFSPRPRENFSWYFDTNLGSPLSAPVGEFLSITPAFWRVIKQVEEELQKAGVGDEVESSVKGVLYQFLTVLEQFGKLIESEIRGIVSVKLDNEARLGKGAFVPPHLPKSWPYLRDDLLEMTSIRGAGSALAKKLGVSRQVVSGWLSGAFAPDADTTIQLLNWTRGIEPQPKKTAPVLQTPRRQKVQKSKSKRKHAKEDQDPPRK